MKFFHKKETAPIKPQTRMIKVLMQDGSMMEYDEHFIITDKTNCVICKSDCKIYHTSLDCENLRWERENCSEPLRAYTVKDAKKQGFVHCMNCSTDLYHYLKGDGS